MALQHKKLKTSENIFSRSSNGVNGAKRVLGVDFTSAPSQRKPITAAWGQISGKTLWIDQLLCLPTFVSFEAMLAWEPSWTAAFDFPFSLPRSFIEEVAPGASWEHFVSLVESGGREEFVASVRAFMAARSAGNKRPARAIDRLAGSASALNIDRPAVGKMFFEGAPRLLRAGVSILPCRPADDARVALEAYPKLVTGLVGEKSYKSDSRRDWMSPQRESRVRIASALADGRFRGRYGFDAQFASASDEERVIEDGSGDLLDAVMCAIQAAWASRQPNFGIPNDCDSLEGWIVDPAIAERRSLIG